MKITIKKWLVFMFVIAIIETAYFGWNWVPSDNAEYICDIAIFSTAMVGAVIIGKRDYMEEKEKENEDNRS